MTQKKEWTEYRDDLEELLTDEMMQICDVAVSYLGIEDEIEERLSREIEGLSDDEFRELWDERLPWSIEEHIEEIES